MNNSVVIDKKFYWELFKSTFLISAFTVGGGFVIIPLILDVGINLLQKELKKKLLLPCLIIFGTFIANYFFQVNIMYLILIDAVIGYLWLQDEKYS